MIHMRSSIILALGIWLLAANHVATSDSLKIVDSIQIGDTVRYAYVGEKMPELLEEGEVKEKRTESSYTVYLGKDENGNDMYRTRTYSQPTFVRDGPALAVSGGERWHTVEYGEDTQENFLAKTRPSVASRIARAIIPPTYAVTIYSHSGDGHIGAFAEDWFDTRNSVDGIVNDEADCVPSPCTVVGAFDEFPPYGVFRAFVPFDTSSIPSGATIAAASLNVYITFLQNDDNDGNDFLTIVRSSQVNYASLATTDFNNIAFSEGIDSGQRKDLTGLATSAYLSFSLNSTGMGWIAKSGQASNCHASTLGITCLAVLGGNDFLDHAPAPGAFNSTGWYPSERTGTSEDPYLDITYTEAGGVTLVRPPNNLGLVGYWSFDDGRGTIATDFSGNGHTGTLVGSPVPSWTSGKRGKALRFDGYSGSNDYVTMGDINATDGLTTLSIAHWIKSASVGANSGGSDYPTTVTNSSCSAGADGSYGFHIESSGGSASPVWFNVDTSNGGNTVSSATNVDDGNWHHVVGTYDGSDIRLWIDGVQVNSTVVTGTLSPSVNHLEVGGHCNDFNGKFYEGSIDEVRIYSRVLGQTEIGALMRGGAARLGASSSDLARGSSLESGLVGHWTFDGGDTNWTSGTTGTTLDRSGNGNTGTMTNMSQQSSITRGILGQGLDFERDANSQRVHFPLFGSLVDGTNDLSMSYWINLESYQSSGDWASAPEFFGFRGERNLGWTGSESPFNQLALWVEYTVGGWVNVFAGSPVFNLDTWYHIVATYDASSGWVIYVNGQQTDTDSSFGAIDGPTDDDGIGVYNTLGGTSGTGYVNRHLDGKMDDVRIYNRTLTPAEAKQLYNLGKVRIVQ